MVNQPKIRKNVLDFCNEVRAKFGLEPVDHLYKGYRKEATSCVISKTIVDDNPDRITYIETEPVGENYSEYTFGTVSLTVADTEGNGSGYTQIRMPKYVDKFACDFDAGVFPDLVSLRGGRVVEVE